MLLSEIIDDIINIASNFLPSDDERLNPRQVAYWIRHYREQALMQFTDYGKDINSELYQDLGTITLTEVDMAEDTTILWGDYSKKATLPEIVMFPENRGWSVSLLDKRSPVIVTTPDVIYFKAKSSFFCCCNIAYAHRIGKTMYITKCIPPDYVNVRAVLANPEDIDGDCFDPATDHYPMPQAMIDTVKTLIMQKELGIGMNMPHDEQNNAKQDFNPSRQPQQ